FSIIGEGRLVIDLVNPAGRQAVVTGATIVSLAGEILTLDLGAIGTHDVSVTLSSATGNHAPMITSNGGGATAAVSIAENTTAVTTVAASDLDAGQTITYAIAGGADATKFSINELTGSIVFLSAPDFEAPSDVDMNNIYDVVVSAHDSAGASDTQTISVTITNVGGVTLVGTSGANTLTGTSEADSLTGLAGNDTLVGLGGNDTLAGGPDDDQLDGGAGNDILLYTAGFDTFDGGVGNDTADFSGFGSAVWIELLRGGAQALTKDQTTLTGSGAWRNLGVLTEIENIVGTAQADKLFGSGADNTLSGGAGNDILFYNEGFDTLDGGTGTDTADFSSFRSAVWVELLRSGAQALTRDQTTLTGNGAWRNIGNLTQIENVVGTAQADQIFGNGGDNTLDGGAGNDMLFYNGGFDTLNGGTGADTADFSGLGSAVWVELLRSGTQALTRDQTTLTGNGSWRSISALTQIENVVGSGYADKLFGDGGNNTLDGGAGDDILFYNGGFDVLNGGAGTDTADFSGFGSAVWVELLRSGAQALTRDQTTLTGNGAWRDIGNLTQIENITGSVHADQLFGNGASNRLTGGTGADRLTGGGGADRFVYTALGDGIDTITDFTAGAGGDVIDIHDVLIGYQAGSSTITDFVRLTQSGGNTTVSVDSDGGANSFTSLVLLQNTSGLLAGDLLANGNLIP
ncbi:MAG: calcium-binding protein, partial [Acidobacteria bacterium]|nr:calcium-binding protein [Acidobacteriota bacterium]